MSLRSLLIPLALLAPLPVLALAQDEAPPSTTTPRPGPSLLVLNKSDDTLTYYQRHSSTWAGEAKTGAGPHEVAVSPDNQLAVVADYGTRTAGSTLTVVHVQTASVMRTIDLGEYHRPHGIVFSGPHTVLVTCEAESVLLEVDVNEGVVLRAMDTGQELSHMVAATPDGELAFVANIGSGSVSVIGLETGELVQVIPTGAGAEGIDVSPDGAQCWVTNRSADTVTVIDVATLEVTATIHVGKDGLPEAFPIRVKLTPDGKRALVSNATSGELLAIDTTTHLVTHRLAMDSPAVEETEGRIFQAGASPVPVGILVEPGGERAYVANTNADIVTVVNLATFAIEERLATGREPDGMAWADVPHW